MPDARQTARQTVGRLGEDAAVGFLARSGWQVLERNARSRYGEIDVVARDGECVVFVEVRARTSDSFGAPEESITPAKAERMVRCALAYISRHPEPAGGWRIDLIAVRLERGRIVRLEHYPNAVEG